MNTKDYQKTTTTAGTPPVPVSDVVALAMGDIAETMREGLLALAAGAGMQVIGVLFDESVTALAGPKGKHDASTAGCASRTGNGNPNPTGGAMRPSTGRLGQGRGRARGRVSTVGAASG